MRETTTIQAVVDKESRGVDAHGEFSFEGQVRENGSVCIAKRYILNGFSLLWLGQIAPYGIVDVWGGYDGFRCNFWMWKEEWCQVYCNNAESPVSRNFLAITIPSPC
jgi:hypothetical protein